MKTLIITGTPRKKGHTIEMAEYLAGQLDGEVEWLSVDNRKDITPCRDCRYCFTHPKCAIDDPMNEIYAKLDAADRIIFASARSTSSQTSAAGRDASSGTATLPLFTVPK